MTAFFALPPLLAHLPPGRHAVIEASAGTGKTYTIEHLVVDRLLATSATIEQILVVTFTDKATGELKSRIRDLITRVLDLPPAAEADGDALPSGPGHVVDEAVRERLKAALFAFDRAPIFTIHGFCHRVLQDLAFESGQLFEFEVADGGRIFNRAFRETLRSRLSVETDLRGLLRAWLDDGRSEAALESLLHQAHRQRYLEGEPIEAGLGQLLSSLSREFNAEDLIADLALAALQQPAFEAACATIRQVHAVLDADLVDGERLGHLAALPLDRVLKPRRVAAHGGRLRFPDELQPATRRFLDRLMQVHTYRALAGSVERAAVDAFLPVVAERLAALKRQEGVVDFDDLLERVQQALVGPEGPALVAALRTRYRLALIDEFQDTDDRQWDIFRRVFVDAPAGEAGTHCLYVIGDPKQAIYGFRGADVHTYLEARALLEDRGAVRLNLDTAFRHSAPLTAALNAVLDQAATAPLFSGAIRYDAPVQCGRPQLRLVDADGEDQSPVILWRYRPPAPGPRERQVLPAYRLQDPLAAQLAESLQRLLLTPEGKLYIQEGDDQENRRAIRPRDVFVLVRSHYEAVVAAEALRRVGLPFAFYRQDGLFQTAEASDVRDVLAAVADPHDRSARMRALATPFFGVPWADLRAYTELPGGHPITERLHAWHQLALHERYPALFHRLLHESGLVERALFLDETERALCNYQHILEVLLEQGGRRRLSLPETLDLLDRFIRRVEKPEGGDGNVQRLPDERDAIQLMTIHGAKGLEAPVVALFGGLGAAGPRAINVVHDPDGGRRVLVGKPAQEAWHDLLEREQREEDERLLYVALTRAQVRLYLPHIDSSRTVQGSYGPLKERLLALAKALPQEFQEVEVPQHHRNRAVAPRLPREPLDAWAPPTRLVTAQPEDAAGWETLRRLGAPLVVTSYTRMKEEGLAPAVEDPVPVEADEFKTDEAAEVDEPADHLPGGRGVGRFLHETIEGLDFARFARHPDFDGWAADPAVVEVFQEVMRRHGIDGRWLRPGQVLIYDALARPLPMGDQKVEALCRCRHIIELEFLYPLPEAGHPLLRRTEETPSESETSGDTSRLEAAADTTWIAERGFIKGFVDFVFEHQDRIYFADWKSDVLPDYAPEALDPHVAEHYELQARLYSLGIVRWLGLRDEAAYEQRFGGLLYIFLRGLGAGRRPRDGVYFRRPVWSEIVAWEAELLTLGRKPERA